MMKIEDLLAKGYFPRELPPPFNTVDFASKYGDLKASLAGCVTKEPTRCIDFSVAKVGLVRKTIKIPNPIHHVRLCETIVDNWQEIELIYRQSKFSFSRPKQAGTRASNPGKFKNFMRKVFLESYPYSYELKTDISKYYPSIYTHSIPWAIHGKAVSKANKGSKNLLGNRIDSEVSNTMYGQTVGIPMGPDTSHIISEIIGCKIDERIASEFPNLKGCRYVDDMYFFFHNEAEAEDALLKLQQTLKEFELQVNAEKTCIRKIPRGIEPDWIILLRSFDFRDTEIKQNNDIISFFSQAFDLAIKLPNDFVLSYAVERVKRLVLLSDANFALLETMLLKTMICEPSTIKEVFRILYSHKSKVRVGKLEAVLLSFIEYHCQRRNEYELAWSLWMARTFEIVISAPIVALLSKIEDPINGLLILHLASLKLIKEEDLDTTRWLQKLNEQYLTDENWLFAYELSLKKWIGTDFAYINLNSYFKQLRKARVSFYDENKQIEVIYFSKLQIVESDQEANYGSESGAIEVQTQTLPGSSQSISRLDDLNLGSIFESFDNMIEGDELDFDYLDY